MPYTNTQHPSNTRTTVTIVMSIIFGVSIIPTTSATTPILYFNLENTDAPTLHQEVRVRFRRGGSTDVDFEEADQFYFIETAKECAADPSTCGVEKQCVGPTDASVTLWTLKPENHGNYAEASVIIKSTEFRVGNAYKMCYIKKTSVGVTTNVYDVIYTLTEGGNAASFTVLSSLYTRPVMEPSTVYAGQGSVTLTITVAADRAKGNKQVTQPAYLIPCTGEECPNTKGVFTSENKDKIASLCSKDNHEGRVTTGAVTDYGKETLTTTFFAPVTPAASYIVCVPYCFKAGNCEGSAVSWVLVDTDTLIKFENANPSSYTIDAAQTTLTFTGTGFKIGDKIRILAKGKVAQGILCPISSITAMPNSEYAHEVGATTVTSDSNTISFTIPAEHAAAAIGQVCYSRADTPNLWAPVFQTAEKTPLYFSLENADVPTLYQEVRVKIRKGHPGAVEPKFADGDKFKETDEIYFEEASKGTAAKQCTTSPTSTLKIKEVATNGEFAMVTVVIKNPEFTVGKTYKMCYIKKGGADAQASQVYEASSTLTSEKNTPVSFTVLSSIYTAHVTTPSTIYSGQGPVELTITSADQKASGKAFGKKEITQFPYLIPCTTADCSDKDRMSALCSEDTTDNKEIVKTSAVTGFGTGTLTTTFFAPVTLAAPASYGICVPYCFKADSCGSAVSWAVVDTKTSIKILPANPLSYTFKSGSPATLTFTGNGLQTGDKIRILTREQQQKSQEGLCIFSTTTPSPNTEYTDEAKAYCPIGSTTSSVSKFTLSTRKAAAITGLVCYSSADSPTVWAPVIEAVDKTVLYFNLENADAPSLYQEVRVKVRRDPLSDTKFVFAMTDKFYFFETTKICNANPVPTYCAIDEGPKCTETPPSDVSLLTVGEVAKDETYAVGTVVIKSAEFKVGMTYKMCYIKKHSEDSCGVAYSVSSSTLSGNIEQTVSFTILSSIYTSHVTKPATVYAGQGPVTLTITGASERAKGKNEMTQPAYLIPCLADECTNNLSDEDRGKDRMASLCSSTSKEGAVTTGAVTGYGTNKLITTFNAPVTPAASASYRVCVAYCFKAGGCEGNEVSWALVNSEHPIEFEAANPSSYTIDASSRNTLTFTGSGLTAGDKIRILAEGNVAQAKGGLCPISGKSQFPNGEYTEEAAATSAKSTVSQFTLNTPLPSTFTGHVCYSRAGKHELWAPVIQSAGQTGSDLIITPKVPTGFSVVPDTPEIGKELELTFTGTDGLTAEDSSYLVTCASEATKQQQSTGILPDSCANTNKANQYQCVITKDQQSAKCKAIINPRPTNSGGMLLCVCYKKKHQSKYALVTGSIPVRPKTQSPAGLPQRETDPPARPPKTPLAPKPDPPPKKETPVRKEILVPPKTEKEVKTDPPKNEQVSPKKKEISPHKPETPKVPKQDGEAGKKDKTAGKTVTPKPDTVPKLPPTPEVPTGKDTDVNKSTTLSATAISSTIPAVLITSVVFFYYLYNW